MTFQKNMQIKLYPRLTNDFDLIYYKNHPIFQPHSTKNVKNIYRKINLTKTILQDYKNHLATYRPTAKITKNLHTITILKSFYPAT